jgi:hypothetical protein
VHAEIVKGGPPAANGCRLTLETAESGPSEEDRPRGGIKLSPSALVDNPDGGRRPIDKPC